MATRELPSRPSFEQYRKQAKDLVKAVRAGHAEALRRAREHHTRERFTLTDAQFVIAREHGFESWPKFVRHLSPKAVFEAAEAAIIRGDDAAMEELLREHEQLFREHAPPPYVPQGPGPMYDPRAHARSIIAREQHFETWEQFAAHRRDPRHAPFEAAIEAIIAGDAATLRRLLREHPDLIRARSARTHHSTLLHYVGANGVEGFRQKTPKNAVEIARILLDAGAEVDATADMYGGGSTTLGLVATSIHPMLAGVQDDLIEFLLERGAVIDHPTAAGNAQNAVNGCLANGRPAAAETLARKGATLDLEGAAGIGWLGDVKRLLPDATPDQLKSGFQWACEYGHTAVVEYLLEHAAIDLAEVHRGQTGLHWAACGGHVEIVRLLLARGAPVDVRDKRWSGTPLGWAIHCFHNPPGADAKPGDHRAVVRLLLEAGAEVEDETMLKGIT